MSGARLAWKSSTPISGAVCRFHPGSVNRGGTWQVEHFALPLKVPLPRAAASSLKPCGIRRTQISRFENGDSGVQLKTILDSNDVRHLRFGMVVCQRIVCTIHSGSSQLETKSVRMSHSQRQGRKSPGAPRGKEHRRASTKKERRLRPPPITSTNFKAYAALL